MSNNNKTPSIRFKGFTDTWEQREFGDENDLITGYPFESDCFSETGINLIRGMNVKRGYIDLSNDICVKWTSSKGLESYLLKENDIIIQMDGALIGKSYGIIKKKHLPALLVQRVTRARINNEIADSDFMYQTIQRDFLTYISMNKTETAVPHLSLNDIKNFGIMVPTLLEQKMIGSFFANLDRLITLHQRKCDKLIQFKAAMLKKMFPQNGADKPELRFKGFTDAWEQRELRTAATFSKGSGYSKNDLKENGTPIILYGRLYTKYETVISEVDTFVDVQPNSVYSTGHEVIVPASGETAEDISRASFVAKSGILLGGDLNIIVPDDYINPVFLALTISNGNQQKELSKRAQGKSVVHIHNSDLENVVLLYPKYEEQEKIGEYFSKLDTLITLHQRKCDKYKSIKAGLIRKFFP